MLAYRARVQHTHNLPDIEVPTRGTKMKALRPSHTGKCGCTGKDSFQRHHDPVNNMFKLNY